MKNAIREYPGRNVDLDMLTDLVLDFFKEEGFRTQKSKHPKGALVQAKKGGVYRALLAMDKSFTVTIESNSSNLKVKIGVGKWLQDLGAEAIETYFTNPSAAFIEVPESLWSCEMEHHLWYHIETQTVLGIQ